MSLTRARPGILDVIFQRAEVDGHTVAPSQALCCRCILDFAGAGQPERSAVRLGGGTLLRDRPTVCQVGGEESYQEEDEEESLGRSCHYSLCS